MLRCGLSQKTILSVTCGLALAVTLNRVLQAADSTPWQRLYYGTDVRVDGLLLGGAAGLVWAWGLAPAHVALTVGAWLGCTVAGVLLVMLPVEDPLLYRLGLTLASVRAAAVVLHVVAGPGRWLSRCLQWRPLVALGRISYGVYLWHHPVAFAAAALGAPWWLNTPVGLPLGIALAAVSHRVVERPALRLKERPRPRQPSPAGVESQAA